MHHVRATIACEQTKRNWQRPDKNNLLMSSPVTKGEDGGRKERKRRWEERGRRIKGGGRKGGKESDGRRDEGGRRKEREGAGEIWRERKQERKRNRKEEKIYNKP